MFFCVTGKMPIGAKAQSALMETLSCELPFGRVNCKEFIDKEDGTTKWSLPVLGKQSQTLKSDTSDIETVFIPMHSMSDDIGKRVGEGRERTTGTLCISSQVNHSHRSLSR